MAEVIKDRVKESTTSTGTGPITLSGAPAGFRPFSSVCAVGDTLDYCIQAVDAQGVPTGDWEVGTATYSAQNTLSRSQVHDSSNAGAPVDFPAGQKQIWLNLGANRVMSLPRLLSEGDPATNIYVSKGGSDSNDGSSIGTAFLTINAAIGAALKRLSSGSLAIFVDDGVYEEDLYLPGSLSVGLLFIFGYQYPSNAVIKGTAYALWVDTLAKLNVGNIKLGQVTGAVDCSPLTVSGGSYVALDEVNFGAVSGNHILCKDGGVVDGTGCGWTISGGAKAHCRVEGGSYVAKNAQITLSGTPAFSNAFVEAAYCGVANFSGAAFTGSATGKRYNVLGNGVVFTNAGGASYLPGSVAGTSATGGQYL